MSSLPPPPSPPPPPPPTFCPRESAVPGTPKSGFPTWGWVVAVVAVLGGGAVALFTLGGDDDKSSKPSITLGSDTTTSGSDGEPVLSSPTTSDTSESVPNGVTGTRDAPVPVGQVADIGNGWRLQVIDVVANADEQMAEADEFFDPAPAGSTYMLVKIALGYFGTEDPEDRLRTRRAMYSARRTRRSTTSVWRTCPTKSTSSTTCSPEESLSGMHAS